MTFSPQSFEAGPLEQSSVQAQHADGEAEMMSVVNAPYSLVIEPPPGVDLSQAVSLTVSTSETVKFAVSSTVHLPLVQR